MTEGQALSRDAGSYFDELGPDAIRILKEHYTRNRAAKTGVELMCVMCGTMFKKKTYHNSFCKTSCKDVYWNTVDDTRRARATMFSRK